MPRVINSAVSTPEAGVPTSYTVDSITLENHSGRQIDINALVTDFAVSESIYLPTVTLSLSVRDTNNLLEEFEICGQEKVTVELSRQDFEKKDKTRIKHVFYVTEYPVYGRNSSLVQAFKLRGISEHAFNSKFMRISRALDGSALELVKNILKDDLKIDEKLIEVGSKNLKTKNVKLIVPNMSPLDAIAWILRRTFDQNGAPFYCYEKFGGGIRIVSQTELVGPDNESIRDYVDAKFFPDKQQTKDDYDQRLARILGLSSDLKMSKFAAGASGAFASTTRYIDLARKSYFEEVFDYTEDFKKMSWISSSGKMTVDPDFRVGKDTKGISQKPEARYNDVVLDGLAPNNYHAQTRGNTLARAASHFENLETFVHDLSIAGDLNIHAGTAIGLKLTKPIDPQVEVKNAESSKTLNFDTFLSGKHLVVSTVHRFDTEYSMDVRLKRDTFNKDLS
jgi:hypothetical protein